MDNFWSSLRQAFGHLGTIRVMDIVDILLVAAFFYFLITLVRRTKTNKLFQGIVYILLALWLSGEMQLYTVNYILRNAVQVGLLALVVLFQPEIRRFLEKLGTGSIFSRLLGAPHTLNADAAITQTVLACVDMSATRTGALIIFERDNRLDDQIRTGTILDAGNDGGASEKHFLSQSAPARRRCDHPQRTDPGGRMHASALQQP